MDRELKRLKAQKDALMKKAMDINSSTANKVEKGLKAVANNYRKGVNEYGIFQSIIEGDQAEAYKKKKADEYLKSTKADETRSNNYVKDRLDKNSDAINKGASKLRSHEMKTGIMIREEALIGLDRQSMLWTVMSVVIPSLSLRLNSSNK